MVKNKAILNIEWFLEHFARPLTTSVVNDLAMTLFFISCMHLQYVIVERKLLSFFSIKQKIQINKLNDQIRPHIASI